MNFLRQIVHSLSQAVKQYLRQWTRPDNHVLVLNAALDLTRTMLELVRENALLRQQPEYALGTLRVTLICLSRIHRGIASYPVGH